MGKTTVKVQVGMPIALHEQFIVYKETERIGTDSEAGAKLIELALRVINNSSDETITNRDLLELILLNVNKNLLFSQQVLKHCFDLEHAKENHIEWYKLSKEMKKQAEKQTDSLISKE
ncbi:hypothetical protein [Vibrio sonorensis]|uniref:hypothetical protein n=1 Tax=Vibrio sonorensis TaxID=1004316 RepID=UPI0008DA4FF5|nr:hypothetical protein [Vibrio sonorensis]